MYQKSTIMIPLTVYGMRVIFTDNNVVSTIDFPFRKTITEVRKEFGDPNDYTILSVQSIKQEFEINKNDFLSSATLLNTSINKTKQVQIRRKTK